MTDLLNHSFKTNIVKSVKPVAKLVVNKEIEIQPY